MSDLQEKKLEEKILLNEEELSKDDFESKKKELESKPGVKVIEIGPNRFKTRIQG